LPFIYHVAFRTTVHDFREAAFVACGAEVSSMQGRPEVAGSDLRLRDRPYGSLRRRLFGAGHEIKSNRVHAIPQVSWGRAVIKDVSQRGIAAAAKNLLAGHPHRPINLSLDVFLGNGLPETGPPGSRLKLGLGIEKNRVAANAAVQTSIVMAYWPE